MRKLLLATCAFVAFAGSAHAADLVPEFKSPTYQNWSGFYFGADVGTAWGTRILDDQFDVSFNTAYSISGVLGGVHAGYNFQSGPIVYGVEGTFAWTNARGSSNLLLESVPVELNPATNIETTMKNVSTVVGRAGFANQAMLYYLLGGIALANEEHLVRQANGIALAPINQDVRSSRSGFVLGFGAEFNVWQNFTAKLEYNYMDFGKKFVAFPAIEGEPVGIRDQLHVVKLGLSYLFH